MKLSDMRRLLAERDLQLTKSLGQNFLHDRHQLDRILAAADLKPTDRVLEIGPGLGPLTELLLEHAGEVLAVELDTRLLEILRERFTAAASRLTLVHADALGWLREQPRDWSGWKLVANLPYSVASPILVELAQSPRGPERMVVTLQLEVAQRITASPGTPDYGLLTLLVQLAYAPVASFRIPATCFFPEPDVVSACLTLVRRPEPLLPVAQIRPFATLVKLAFSQRRKKLIKLLKSAWPLERLEAVFGELGLDPQVRGEKLSLEQFVQLTRRLAGPNAMNPAQPAPMSEELFDVVNDRDEVIGQRPRREVHRLGLKHRAVHVLIFNRAGQVFLQKRSPQKDCHPGTWDSSASGHLAPGESYDDCAVREVEEELGWRLPGPPRPVFKIEACADTGQEFVWVYRAEAEGPFRLHPEEISDGGWFAPEALDQWLAERPQEFAPALPLIWRRLKAAPELPGPAAS